MIHLLVTVLLVSVFGAGVVFVGRPGIGLIIAGLAVCVLGLIFAVLDTRLQRFLREYQNRGVYVETEVK